MAVAQARAEAEANQI